MDEWLPTSAKPSAPLHRASVRKGVQLEALSCPPPSAAGREGRPGSLSACKGKGGEKGLRGGGKAGAWDEAGQGAGPQYLTKNA